MLTTALGEGRDDLTIDPLTCRIVEGHLSGHKPLVSGALQAQAVLVAAADGDAVVLVSVAMDAPGVQARPIATIGRGGDADLVFSDVSVAPRNRYDAPRSRLSR